MAKGAARSDSLPPTDAELLAALRKPEVGKKSQPIFRSLLRASGLLRDKSNLAFLVDVSSFPAKLTSAQREKLFRRIRHEADFMLAEAGVATLGGIYGGNMAWVTAMLPAGSVTRARAFSKRWNAQVGDAPVLRGEPSAKDVDAIVGAAVHSGLCELAIQVLLEEAPREPTPVLGQAIGAVSTAFIMLGRSKEGVKAMKVFVRPAWLKAIAKRIEDFEPAVALGNLACLHGAAGDAAGTAKLMRLAFAQKSDSFTLGYALEEKDFAPVRNSPAVRAVLAEAKRRDA